MSDQRRIFGTAQVDRDHYFGEKYLGVSRFTSLHSQFHLCMRGDPCDTYLEIGPGPGLLVGLLKHFGRNITTVDIAKDLNPDYIAALPSLPFEDNSFDIVCAFEVLEHIPKDMLPLCIREAKRLARKRILISLPNQCNIYDKSVSFRIAVGNWCMAKTVWRKKLNRVTNPEEHYWEIGHDGITVDTIVDAFKDSGFQNIETFLVKPWFQFFVVEVTDV